MKKVILLMIMFVVAGCNELDKHVKRELMEGGFTLWYPAEEGVEPGQIWITNGKEKHILQRRPDGLPLEGPKIAKFKTLKKKVEADMTLDISVGEEILGEVGELAVLLKSATVKDVDLDFGKTHVTRFVLGDLADPKIRETLSDAYLDDVVKARIREDDAYVLIDGVLTSSGMKFTFTCEDTKQLKAQAPKISELIKAELNLEIKSDKKASWEIPETKDLVIGISFAPTETRDLEPKEVKSRAIAVQNALLKLKTVPLEQLIEANQ
jgi:hypothetical protein